MVGWKEQSLTIKSVLLTVLLTIFALIIQATFRSFWPNLVYIQPQLTLTIIAFWALHVGSVSACGLVFFIGLLLDASSSLILGPWAGASVVAYGIVATLSVGLFIDSIGTVILSSGFVSFISLVIYAALTFDSNQSLGSLMLTSFSQSLITALLAPFLFQIIRFFYTIFGGIKFYR